MHFQSIGKFSFDILITTIIAQIITGNQKCRGIVTKVAWPGPYGTLTYGNNNVGSSTGLTTIRHNNQATYLILLNKLFNYFINKLI